MSEQKMIAIEVAYALPDEQVILTVEVAEGTSVFDAAKQSGIEQRFAGLSVDDTPMGIFGKAVRKPKEEKIKAGQRIEIYRPLIIDPKEARANRAAKAAAEKKSK
jgi:putative ubiquitin-RnfH superfamily antitoxin RatB of RatAB toxin-antitoxin module